VTKQSHFREIAADFVLATFGIATPVNTLYLNLPLPSRERTEVRGTDPRTFFHPHPNPLPSREREIMEGVCKRLGSQ
jgi:hypothetical protein